MTNGTYPSDQDGEEWRDVYGYEGLYMVSSLGRVRSHDGTPIADFSNGRYRQACLRKDGGYKNHLVHRLVASAFYGPKHGDPRRNPVHHRDGNPINNRLENLEWSTPAENNRARMIGDNNFYKLSYDLADEMRALYARGEWTYKTLAAKYGVSKSTVSLVINGKRWVRPDNP